MARATDSFVRANNPSLGANWSTPVGFPINTGSSVVVTGGMQLLNNAFAPITSAGGAAMSLWVGVGAPFANDQFSQATISAIAGFTSVVAITQAAISGSNTTYTYTLSSGSVLTTNQQIYITGMADAGNNGPFIISGLGAGTFTVVNASGVNRAGQSGTGNSPSDSDCGLVVRGSVDGLNGYLLYVGTNSDIVASGGTPSGGSRVYDVELWKIVAGTATFIGGGTGNGSTTIPDSANDVYLLMAVGNKITAFKNGVVSITATDNGISSGAPGIMTWSVAPPGEWANPTTYGVGNSGTQFTSWIGGDDNNNFSELAADAFTAGTALTQVAADNFTRADGGIGSNWVASASALQIVSNKAEATVANTRTAAYWGGGQTFDNDQYAEATVAAINGTSLGGPVVRAAGAGVKNRTAETGYILLIPKTGTSANLIVQRIIDGANATSILTVASITPAVNDVFRISAVGTTITVFQNGVSKGSVVDANLTTGFPGLFCLGTAAVTDCQFSAWAGGGVGAPSTFSTRLNQDWMSNTTNGIRANVWDAASTFAELYQNVVSWPNDQYAQATITQSGVGTGPAVRLSTSADTGYFFINNAGSTATLVKISAGTATQLESVAYTFNATDVFRIEVIGGLLVAKINGSVVMFYNDSSVASGKAGMASSVISTTATFKTWSAGSITAAAGASVTSWVNRQHRFVNKRG